MIITKSDIQPENIIKMGKFLIMFHVKKKKKKKEGFKLNKSLRYYVAD